MGLLQFFRKTGHRFSLAFLSDIRANAFVFLPPDARDEDDCTLEIDDDAFDLVDLEVAWLLKEWESESTEDNDSA